MPPLRGGMDPLAAEALRARRASERAREGRVKRVAAQVASQATSVRGKLFDADEWLKVHSVRQERIETTFTRLYKPTGRSYWIEPKPKPPVKPLPGSQMLPAYVNDLPRALSLSHPATHEEEEGEETELELAEEVVESKPREEPFDPMAGPMEFYRNFKSRLSALRESAAAPPPTRTQIRPFSHAGMQVSSGTRCSEGSRAGASSFATCRGALHADCLSSSRAGALTLGRFEHAVDPNRDADHHRALALRSLQALSHWSWTPHWSTQILHSTWPSMASTCQHGTMLSMSTYGYAKNAEAF
ncbi:MAG: hypothetical protein SGPRY_006061 [Prymnesium sp.]